MKRVFFLLIYILFLISCVKGQTQTYTIKWDLPEKINYHIPGSKTSQSKQRLSFSNASYPGNFHIPYYQKTWNFAATITIENCIWQDLSPHENYILNNYGPQLCDSLTPETSILLANDTKITSLSILPFRHDRQRGKNQKLMQFALKIKQKGTPQNTKKTLSLSTKGISPLNEGKWWRLKIPQSGIYAIKYESLLEKGFSNPEGVSLYSHFEGQLPVDNAPVNDTLTPLAIKFDKGADGLFNEGDYLYFYAKGASYWRYNTTANHPYWHNHSYANENYVYISNQALSKLVTPQASPSEANETIDSYLAPFIEKTEQQNLLSSGQLWLGDLFESTTSRAYTFSGPQFISSAEAYANLSVVASSGVNSKFTLYTANSTIGTIELPKVNLSSQTGIQAHKDNKLWRFTNTSSQEVKLTLSYNRPENSSRGWLDYLEVYIPARLRYSDKQFQWFTPVSTPGNHKWELQTSSSNLKIWDITNPYTPKEVETQRSGSLLSFRKDLQALSEFIAFTYNNAYTPVWDKEINNQSICEIGNCEFLIITHPSFITEARRLAQAHLSLDNLITKVVTTEQIYNEYTSGKPDAGAIRNYIRDCKFQPDSKLKYVLLFGDGNYDNKGNIAPNSSLIPTYQSVNSLTPTQSFVSDDFYGLLDPDENIEGTPSGLLDIGIGRFPVSTQEQAKVVVDKSIQYLMPQYRDSWQQRMCFVGDDEDNNVHMRDADRLASFVDTTQPYLEIKKLYLDAFNQESSLINESYPEVNREIAEQINNGVLLFNYTGHGGETGLAHERVVTLDDINSWSNSDRLALFMTATCEFSRFDDYKQISAGEQVLLNPNGGAVALATTTRLVYSSPNYELNRKFYDHFFTIENGQALKLGEVFRRTKTEAGTGNNKRNFTLLGNPALPIPIPGYQIVTDSINGIKIDTFNDTLKALSTVTFSGHINTPNGIFDANYQGTLTATLLDKPREFATLSNDGGDPFMFKARLNPIFKGEVTIQNGTFSFTFIIPKDITLTPGEGRMLYYSKSTMNNFGKGATEGFLIGDIEAISAPDNTGPAITLFMNDTTFRSGGITNQSPKLLAYLADQQGINALGNGIGHDITAWLDDDTQHPIILNSYYIAKQNSYQEGSITYQLPELSPGIHNIKLKAWDSFNNSNEASITFKVASNKQLSSGNAFAYPNPFSAQTTFVFEHNYPNKKLQVTIEIFDLTGRKITRLRHIINSPGFRSIPIPWNGTANGNKLNNGVYLYTLTVKTETGEKEKHSGKIILAE